MNDLAFPQYVSPKEVKEYKFSINLDAEDHTRLLWWLERNKTPEVDTRAAAARFAIRSFLDAEKVPSAVQIISARRKSVADRQMAIDLFLDEQGVPSAEEIEQSRRGRGRFAI